MWYTIQESNNKRLDSRLETMRNNQDARNNNQTMINDQISITKQDDEKFSLIIGY
jgi:hypothetical protein